MYKCYSDFRRMSSKVSGCVAGDCEENWRDKTLIGSYICSEGLDKGLDF
jgi:hypothetical protein